MKKLIVASLCALFMFCLSPVANAGFVVKKQSLRVSGANLHAPGKLVADDHHPVKSKFGRLLTGGEEHHHHHGRKPSESGWEGITAFVCAMAGIGPLGIIFGAMGMGRGHKNRGLAIAGFVIGLSQVLLFAIIITLVAMAYA